MKRLPRKIPRTPAEQAAAQSILEELRIVGTAALIIRGNLRRGAPLEGALQDLRRIVTRADRAADTLEDAMLADELQERGRE